MHGEQSGPVGGQDCPRFEIGTDTDEVVIARAVSRREFPLCGCWLDRHAWRRECLLAVVEEALARLATEVTGGDHATKAGDSGVVGIAELVVESIEDGH